MCVQVLCVLLYSFFWVIPRHLNFMCRHFGTICPLHLHRSYGPFVWLPSVWILCADISEHSVHSIIVGHRSDGQSVPKRHFIKFRCRGFTQKKEHNIHNMAKVFVCQFHGVSFHCVPWGGSSSWRAQFLLNSLNLWTAKSGTSFRMPSMRYNLFYSFQACLESCSTRMILGTGSETHTHTHGWDICYLGVCLWNAISE